MGWLTVGGLILFGLLVLPSLELRFNADREFAELALRDSDLVRGDFEFISSIKAEANPARGPRGFGQHAWSVKDGRGYFTFHVRGYRAVRDTASLHYRDYRVHFVTVLGKRVVSVIEKDPPWIAYGEEPNQAPEPTTMSVTPPAAQEPRQP